MGFPPARPRLWISFVFRCACLFCCTSDDVSDGNKDDPVHSPNLPDLDYESHNGSAPTFDELENPEETWDQIFESIRKALVSRGHDCCTKVRPIERVCFNWMIPQPTSQVVCP